jgi:hypothetical protein
MRDTEPPESSATPSDAATSDDEWEEQPRASSLHPSPAGFSQRRLLNIASVGLAARCSARAVQPAANPYTPNAKHADTTRSRHRLEERRSRLGAKYRVHRNHRPGLRLRHFRNREYTHSLCGLSRNAELLELSDTSSQR